MRPDREAALYARSIDGVAALKVAKGAKEVKVVLAPAARSQVGSSMGKGIRSPGWTVPDHAKWTANLSPYGGYTVTKLEPDGRYQFSGLIPGAEYQITYVQGRGNSQSKVHEIKRFRVNGAGKIDLGDFNVPDPKKH